MKRGRLILLAGLCAAALALGACAGGNVVQQASKSDLCTRILNPRHHDGTKDDSLDRASEACWDPVERSPEEQERRYEVNRTLRNAGRNMTEARENQQSQESPPQSFPDPAKHFAPTL